MIIKYRSHTFTVPDSDLIVMGDSFYAKVDLGQRGQSFPHYIKVTPPVAEVVDPRLTGMVYDQPAIPQNFDSGLLYDQPQPFKPLIIALPADMIGQVGGGKGKNKRPTIPGVILADCAHVSVIKPVTLWTPALRAA